LHDASLIALAIFRVSLGSGAATQATITVCDIWDEAVYCYKLKGIVVATRATKTVLGTQGGTVYHYSF
jgi:hypothetical protein